MNTPPAQDWSRLLSLAFDQVDAVAANEAMFHHRAQREEAGLLARSYEVVAPDPLPPLSVFLEGLCPRLSSHLESLGLARHGSEGVFVSLFVQDRLYFLDSVAVLRLQAPVALLPGRSH